MDRKKMKTTRLAISVFLSLLFVSAVSPSVQSASYLHSSTFETGDLSEWDSSNGTPDVAGAYNHSGSYGCKFDSDTSGAGDYVLANDTAWLDYEHFQLGLYFQLKHDLQAFDILTMLVCEEESNDAVQLTLEYEAGLSAQLRCYTHAGESNVFNLTKDTWYHLLIDSVIGGETDFYLDNETFTLNSTSYGWDTLRLGACWRGSDSGVNVDLWFDDIYLQRVSSLSEQIDAILDCTIPVLGSSGLIMLVFCPYYFITRLKKKEIVDVIAWSMVLAIVGFAFVVVWLWG